MQLNQTGASTWLSAVATEASPAAGTDFPLLLSTGSPLPRRGGAAAPTPAPCTPQGWGLTEIPGVGSCAPSTGQRDGSAHSPDNPRHGE